MMHIICNSLPAQPSVHVAYLDPTVGTMIISAIVGVFATLVLAAKTYSYKIKLLLRGRKSRSDDAAHAEKKTDAK